jgi:tetratricopeptide (TPR) repeat protein
MTSSSIVDVTVGIPRDCITCDGPGCDRPGPMKRCARCRATYYCSVACQKSDWVNGGHKPYCFPNEMMYQKSREDQAGPPLDRSLLQPSAVPDTECPICLDTTRQPVTLKQCQHTFCTSCLVEWQKQLRHFNYAKPPFPCPLCRTDVEDVEQGLMKHAALLAGEANMRKSLDEEARHNLRKEALDCLDRLLVALQPNASVQAYCYKAQILVELGMGREAIQCIEELMTENEKRKNHPLLLLIQQQEQAEANGDYDENERLQEACMKYYSEHGNPPTRLHQQSMFGIHMLKSRAYQVMEEWHSAMRAYCQTLRLLDQPTDAPAAEQRKLCMSLAHCAYMAKDYERSIASSEMAIEMNRHFDEVHKYKALSLKALGKLDEAIVTMNRAVLYEATFGGQKALQLYRELVAERAAVQES